MRITKHEHATLRLTEAGKSIIVDPGAFTTPLDALTDVVAVVITHEHPDHWTPAQLDRILRAAPGVPIFSTAGVAAAAEQHEVTIVQPGDEMVVEDISLRFFGGDHAVIHESVPAVHNLGVLFGDALYYPGDSYAIPEGVSVNTLAAPLGAPWLKIGEAMDFVLAVGPQRCFGTHDMTLSAIGRAMHRERLQWATEQRGGTFFELEPGQSLDI